MKYGRKITGGRYHKFRKKKKYSLPGIENKIKLGEIKQKVVRTRGGNKKTIILKTNYANIFDKKTNKSKRIKIKNVLETPANKFLARENILIRGAIIDTELGKARITNRPSHDGNVQGLLIE